MLSDEIAREIEETKFIKIALFFPIIWNSVNRHSGQRIIVTGMRKT